jgi:hypothetical protein
MLYVLDMRRIDHRWGPKWAEGHALSGSTGQIKLQPDKIQSQDDNTSWASWTEGTKRCGTVGPHPYEQRPISGGLPRTTNRIKIKTNVRLQKNM